MNFEALEQKQSIPYLKVMVYAINASSSQWCGCIFILFYINLTLALLFHKQGYVDSQMVPTVGGS